LFTEQSIIVFSTVNSDNSEKSTNPTQIQFLKTVNEERRAEVMAQYNASKSFGSYAKQDLSSNKAEKQGNIYFNNNLSNILNYF